MLVYCPSKTCHEQKPHKLRVETNEAVCMECGEVNPGITDFTKKAMKSNGDVFRANQSKKPFTFKCSKCGVDRGAKVVKDQALCEVCEYPLNVSGPMKEALKTHGAKTTKEASEPQKGKINRRTPDDNE